MGAATTDGAEPRLEIPLPRRGGLLGLAGLVLLGALAWWVTTSPLFRLHSLDVVGNHHLSTSRVASLGGLTRSTNVLWLSSAVVERRLEANPLIRSAEVTRSLPSTLLVTVTERTPVAVLGSGRSAMLVAGDGVILGRAHGDRKGLPSIRGIAGRAPATTGGRVRTGDPGLAAVAALPSSVRARVSSVQENRDGFVVLRMRTGFWVRFGNGSGARAKGRVLAGVLSWARVHGVRPRSINVTSPDAPALQPA